MMSAAAMPVNPGVALDDAPAYETQTHAVRDLRSLEAELSRGLLDEWRRVVDEDPLASLYQTAGWCMPWYRCYRQTYDPYVLVVASRGRMVGLVPMAVHRETGEFVFASNTMADYRDIVALPGYRELVVSELVRCYLEGGFPNPLRVGWIDPGSDTPALLEKICRDRGLRSMVHHHVCWRWFPPPPQKPSAQKFLNWYKRHGAVTFEVIESEAAWVRFRDEYYRQHSLRQIQAGRQTSFDDDRKAALYEQLFHSRDVQCHVTAFCVDGTMLAGHFGYVWRGVLLLGPPSIRLEDEQRSPAVILLAWIIQHAAELGLSGFDLTIGDGDFKKRLGNQSVDLTMVDVYGSKRQHYVDAARSGMVGATRRVVEAAAGEAAWKDKVKPAAAWLGYKRRRVREMGIATALGAGLRSAITAVADRRTGLVYSMTPGQLQPVQPTLGASETYEVHDNCVEDLLLWDGTSPSVESALTTCARSYARVRNGNRTLHTIVVTGRLAGWGYSYVPTEPATLSETPGAVLAFEPNSVSLYDFHLLPEFRGRRLYQALLTAILQRRFAEGTARAYITVLESNTPSRAAIERVGFTITRRNHYRRLLRRERLTSTEA